MGSYILQVTKINYIKEAYEMSKIAKGGYASSYGQAIGIILLDATHPKIPGDIGNATTFDFPVKYVVLKGVKGPKVVHDLDSSMLEPFISAAKKLEEEGAKAITTSCGFLALFQQEIANAVKIPVFTSSLIQVPLVYRMLGNHHKVGIITIDSLSLTERHFDAVGAKSIPKVVMGTEEGKEFSKALIGNNSVLDIEKATEDLVFTANKLVSNYPEVGAIVFECANMAPYAKAVQDAVKLPVFNIVTLTNMVYSGVIAKNFIGYM